MGNFGSVAWLALLAASAIGGCSKEAETDLPPAPEAPFPFLISIASDARHPVAGAKVVFKTKPIAASDASGLAKVEVSGTEGDTVALSIQCPDGFSSPEKPIVAGLRRLGPSSPPPRFEARCAPMLRTVVVAIRTENGANLPVQQLGRVVAHTDAGGVAHFVMQVKPAETITLTLDTSEKGFEALRPQSPTLQFVTKDQDELVLLEQKFKIEKKKVVVKTAPKPMPL